jgi:hypothetical protein
MKEGFTVGKDFAYAAIPYGNLYLIIHNGQQLEKVCRTESSARKYIEAHRKGKSLGELPLN